MRFLHIPYQDRRKQSTSSLVVRHCITYVHIRRRRLNFSICFQHPWLSHFDSRTVSTIRVGNDEFTIEWSRLYHTRGSYYRPSTTIRIICSERYMSNVTYLIRHCISVLDRFRRLAPTIVLTNCTSLSCLPRVGQEA